MASALYWLSEYHADGLRVDAVASMLYRDYSRAAGEWVPNEYGGREDLEAIGFLRELNEVTHAREPGTIMAAEESTAWPAVSRPTDAGGLGFDFKWNMGWMHDTLEYFAHEPVHRRYHHDELTFSLVYAFTEQFVLPLSHDEVVHGKGSLLSRMPGDDWQRHANLRALYAYMWAHPGKKLLFMGGELAQEQEWSHERSLDWHLLGQPAPRRACSALVRDLNRLYRATPALWQLDAEPGRLPLAGRGRPRRQRGRVRALRPRRQRARGGREPLAGAAHGLPPADAAAGSLARGAQQRRGGLRRRRCRQHGPRRGRRAALGRRGLVGRGHHPSPRGGLAHAGWVTGSPGSTPLGAVPEPGGTTTFRVWAPRPAGDAGAGRPRRRDGGRGGRLRGRVEAAPGEDYRVRPDGGEALPDPCSRHQPEGVRGPSRVVDPAAFAWDEGGWAGLDRRRPVLYELHVGTFTPDGTFAAAGRAPARAGRAGVTAIELTPVATSPDARNWGYDGLYAGAPHEVYGGPEGLAGLVARPTGQAWA